MEENNRLLSDEELEAIAAGNNEECLELLKWCKNHGAYVSLTRTVKDAILKNCRLLSDS
jgi:hypothetical protein